MWLITATILTKCGYKQPQSLNYEQCTIKPVDEHVFFLTESLAVQRIKKRNSMLSWVHNLLICHNIYTERRRLQFIDQKVSQNYADISYPK